MRLFYLCIFIIGYQSFTLAQSPDIEWAHSFGGTLGDFAQDIIQTNEGGYIVAGSTYSNDNDVTDNHGDNDIWIIKLNSIGELEWQKTLGGTLAEQACAIRQTPDGSFILAGTTFSNDGDVSGNHGERDYWLVKLSTTGAVIWQKCFGGPGKEIATDLQLTTDNGFIMSGYTQSTTGQVSGNHGGQDAWIIKLNANGDLQWSLALGGSKTDGINAILPTPDGGFFLAGFSTSSNGDVPYNHGNSGNNDYWMVKIAEEGAIEWSRSSGGTLNDEATAVCAAVDGGYIVTGFAASSNGDVLNHIGAADCWTLKLNTYGDIIWQNIWGTAIQYQDDTAQSILQTADGQYIVAGETNRFWLGEVYYSDCAIFQIDDNGATVWEKVMGGSGPEAANTIRQTADGGFIVAANTESEDGDVTGNYGAVDFWIVKLSKVTGVTTLDPLKEKFTISPNPTTGRINIQLDKNAQAKSYSLFDSTGKLVFSSNLASGVNQFMIDLSGTPEGLYFIQVNMGGKSYAQKIVVK